jgi:hypothetical protein
VSLVAAVQVSPVKDFCGPSLRVDDPERVGTHALVVLCAALSLGEGVFGGEDLDDQQRRLRQHVG